MVRFFKKYAILLTTIVYFEPIVLSHLSCRASLSTTTMVEVLLPTLFCCSKSAWFVFMEGTSSKTLGTLRRGRLLGGSSSLSDLESGLPRANEARELQLVTEELEGLDSEDTVTEVELAPADDDIADSGGPGG